MKMFVGAVLCLVTGFTCLINSADGLDPVTITAIATVAGGAVVGGPSFLSWGLSGNTLIETNITVENWTRFPMTNPELRLRSGVVSLSPRDIQPGTKEIFHVRKSRFVARGSVGTVSWLVNGNKRIVVMWSVPYDYLYYENWLAVGIAYFYRHAPGNQWYEFMYNNTPYCCANFPFDRRQYSSSVSPVIVEHDRYIIRATMGTGHDAQVRIQVRPRYGEDFAVNLQTALTNQGLPWVQW